MGKIILCIMGVLALSVLVWMYEITFPPIQRSARVVPVKVVEELFHPPQVPVDVVWPDWTTQGAGKILWSGKTLWWDCAAESFTKDSLKRDFGLEFRCSEERYTGKQVNPSSTTAWIPCSRIDQLWMDGQKVWERERGKK
jgi:hypothetical protein